MKIPSQYTSPSSIKITGQKFFLLILLICFSFFLYIKYTIHSDLKKDLTFTEKWHLFQKKISHKFHNPAEKLPTFKIHIKQKHWDQIAFKRHEALENWVPGLNRIVLEKTKDDWQPCQLEWEGKKVDAKVRLKGRLKDHWDLDHHWSLNIKFKDEVTFQGMREFTIQHPKTRNYISEWLFHQLLKENGLIYLRYDFCQVSINGKEPLIYAYEEGLDKRLIENNRLREGPILKFNTDANWFYGNLNLIDFQDTELQAYELGKIEKNPALHQQLKNAIRLLNEFRQGLKETNQVFDVNKWARFFAILDFLGRDHAGHYDNCRFYYNPITCLIEPIGRDNQVITYRTQPLLGDSRVLYKNAPKNWFDQLFKDHLFFAAYIRELHFIYKKENHQKWLDQLKPKLEKRYDLLKEYDLVDQVTPDELFKRLSFNANLIRQKLIEKQKDLQFYSDLNQQEPQFQIINACSFPIELIKITSHNKIIHQWDQPLFMQSKQAGNELNFKTVKVKLKEPIDKDSCFLHYQHFQSNVVFEEKVIPYLYAEQLQATDTHGEKIFIENNSLMQKNEESKTITFLSGKHIIDKPIEIPDGYQVIAQNPLELNLIKHAYISSRSPLTLESTKESPIHIYSSDHTGSIVVYHSKIESLFNYVKFSNLNRINNDKWQLTGAITFYESDAVFKHCVFENNHCEDALNSFRSKITLQKCEFNNIFADAFDGDFVTAILDEVHFNQIGNDAIDVSGSEITISQILINQAGDKGISVGENSNLLGNQVEIYHTSIAVASKDSSFCHLKNIQLNQIELGFTAYNKKPEYEGGTVVIKKLTQENTKRLFLREKNSMIKNDGQEIPVSNEKVKDILYGVEYGKKSQR